MTPLKSQILGLLLGLATAVGCIFYEKIVHNFSYTFFLIILGVEILCLGAISYFFIDGDLSNDLSKFSSDSKYFWWCLVYVVTGVTSILWYVITKNQSVMAGSLYEVKYIVMLALIYIAFGESKFTFNTMMGVLLAMGSIYFISKK